MPLLPYIAERTWFVNKTSDSYLIRGNQPLNEDGTLSLTEISNRLEYLISGFTASDYNFIVVTTINNNQSEERDDLMLQFSGFGINQSTFDSNFPESIWPPYYNGLDVKQNYGSLVDTSVFSGGSIIWYPFVGCTGQTNCEETEPVLYNFSGLVDYLQYLLESPGKNVIYVCSVEGHNRTSSIISSYMVKYMTIRKFPQYNDVIHLGPPDGGKGFPNTWVPEYLELVTYFNDLINP